VEQTGLSSWFRVSFSHSKIERKVKASTNFRKYTPFCGMIDLI
jgi:hypothetical protein